MEINNIHLYSNTNSKTSKKEKTKNNSPHREIYEYPKNFVPYFGARVNRSPENFYAQEFNLNNMPVTVKKYLEQDEARKQIAPLELQQQAFAKLNACKTVEDIKAAYPDEPLFKNLVSLADSKASKGYLHFLRSENCANNDILKNGEDLTVYIVKKIYLEGNTLEEINENFDKDVNEKYKLNNVPEKYKSETGKYFLHSTITAMKIPFPNVAYWNSFRATNADWYKLIKRQISPESREKRSKIMSEYWLNLSPEEKEERIAKMRKMDDPEFRTFAEFQSPIMVFAAAEINLSDKLSDFLQQQFDENEYITDFSDLTDKMKIFLSDFWEENPQLKEDFSKAIKKSIKMFQDAQAIGESAVQTLYHTADMIQNINKQKGYLRKQEAEIEKRADELNLQTEKIDTEWSEIAAEKETLEEENKAMEELVAEENARIEQENKKLSQQKQEVSLKEKNLNEREEIINRAETFINARISYLHNKENELNQREKMLNDKESKIENEEKKLDEQQNKLNEDKRQFEQQKAEFGKNQINDTPTVQQDEQTEANDKKEINTEEIKFENVEEAELSDDEKAQKIAHDVEMGLRKKCCLFPDEYSDKMLEYVFDEKYCNKQRRIKLYNQLASSGNEYARPWFCNIVENAINKCCEENPKFTKTMKFAAAQVIYNYNPVNNEYVLLAGDTGEFLKKNKLSEEQILKFKSDIANKVNEYNQADTEKVVNKAYEMFAPIINKILNTRMDNGDIQYTTIRNEQALKRLCNKRKYLKDIISTKKSDKDKKLEFMKFIENYIAELQFIQNDNYNIEDEDKDRKIRTCMIETIINAFLKHCENKEKSAKKK